MSGMDRLTEADREQITKAAYEAHRNWCRGARGQMISEWDSIESWIAVETAAFLAHRRASQAAAAPSDHAISREWAERMLPLDEGVTPSAGAPAPSDGLREAVDAAWNDAIEAAGNLESIHGYSNAVPRHRIRALRRAAPTEGEACPKCNGTWNKENPK